MNKKITKIVPFCDVCGREMLFSSKCKICGRDFCYKCRKENVTEFRRAVHFSGSGDSFYCNVCLAKPIPPEHFELLTAYKRIESLMTEFMVWDNEFKARCSTAEAIVQKLLEESEA